MGLQQQPLDVSRHESRQARGRPALRELLQPQLQGPAGLPDRPHGADEPDHGRRRRHHRPGRRRPRGLQGLMSASASVDRVLARIAQEIGRAHV